MACAQALNKFEHVRLCLTQCCGAESISEPFEACSWSLHLKGQQSRHLGLCFFGPLSWSPALVRLSCPLLSLTEVLVIVLAEVLVIVLDLFKLI